MQISKTKWWCSEVIKSSEMQLWYFFLHFVRIVDRYQIRFCTIVLIAVGFIFLLFLSYLLAQFPSLGRSLITQNAIRILLYSFIKTFFYQDLIFFNRRNWIGEILWEPPIKYYNSVNHPVVEKLRISILHISLVQTFHFFKSSSREIWW